MNITCVLLMTLVANAPSPQTVGSRALDLTAIEFTTHASVVEGNGPYYVVQLALPQDLETARRAWLEIYLDVAARAVGGWSDSAPVLEVYELARALSGEPTVADFVPREVPTHRIVATGEDRFVRVDITKIVQRMIRSPETNNGLIVGSLTNGRAGLFELQSDVFGANIVARVTIME